MTWLELIVAFAAGVVTGWVVFAGVAVFHLWRMRRSFRTFRVETTSRRGL